MSIENIWAVVAAILGAFILVSNAAEKVGKAVQAARAPNELQDNRIKALEDWKEKVDEKLLNDKQRFEDMDKSNRITQRAILALLDHGIDGNNTEQMKSAKEELQTHLINR